MKKCILGFLLLLFSNSVGFAQSEEAFEKNDFIVTGGFGLGLGYGYQNYTAESLHQSSYSYGTDFRLNYTIGAVFPVTAEYAISNKFGLGLAYQHGAYVNSNSDKSTNNNFGIFGAFHFAKRSKVELYTRLILGYSVMDYTEETGYYYYDPNAAVPSNNGSFQFKLKGGYVKPSFGMRLYFTEHIGMFADIGIGVYSYHANQVETDLGTYDLAKRFNYVMFNGELTTGLAVKF